MPIIPVPGYSKFFKQLFLYSTARVFTQDRRVSSIQCKFGLFCYSPGVQEICRLQSVRQGGIEFNTKLRLISIEHQIGLRL